MYFCRINPPDNSIGRRASSKQLSQLVFLPLKSHIFLRTTIDIGDPQLKRMMQMNRKNLLLIIASAIILSIIIIRISHEPTRETITFFPIDAVASFSAANTNLALWDGKSNGEYSLEWRISSTLDRKAYLRQDVGLLYANGRLIGRLGEWKENTAKMVQSDKINWQESSLFQEISFHYAEIHGQKDEFTSSQLITGDQLYVINSSFSPLQSFRIPNNKEATEWKKVIDNTVSKELEKSWIKGASEFSINLQLYDSFPLVQLANVNNPALNLFTKQEKQRIIGNLWEGLYKNLFLGVKMSDGTVADPMNSTLPLILVAKDKSHLIVLFETADGEAVILRQQI